MNNESRIKNNESSKTHSKFKIHNSSFPLFHTDAVQAFQYLPCDMRTLGVDFMTLSAHKLYGPKGVGALYVRDQESRIMNNELRIKNNKTVGGIIHNSKFIIHPVTTGGGQEFGMRSGTENVAGIAGFAEAIALADARREKERVRILKLKRFLWKGIHELFPEAEVNGNDDFENTAPHILNVAFRESSADELLARFDMEGIAVSTGSACASRAPAHSHVLSALFARAPRGIRFSFGRMTTKEEVNEVLRRMKRLAERRGHVL